MSASGERAEPQTGPGSRRRLTATAWAVITAVIALAGTLLSIVFQLVPDLKPDPREKVAAALRIFAVEPQVTLDDWLHRAFPGDYKGARRRILGHDTPVGDELNFRGEVVYVRTQVDGFKHRSVNLRARLYNLRSQEWVSDFSDDNITGRASRVKLDAPSRSSVQLLFIADLSDETRPQFVRVELYDDTGVLAVADSSPLLAGKATR